MSNNKNKKQQATKPVKKTKQENQVKKQTNDELSPKTIMIFRVFILVALVATLVAIGLIVYELLFSKDDEIDNPYEDYYVLNHETVIEDLEIILNPKAEEGFEINDIQDERLRTIIQAFYEDSSKTVYILTYHSTKLDEKLDEELLAATHLKKSEQASDDANKDYIFLLIDLDNAIFIGNGFEVKNLNSAFENVDSHLRDQVLYAFSYDNFEVSIKNDDGFYNGASLSVDKIIEIIKGLETN